MGPGDPRGVNRSRSRRPEPQLHAIIVGGSLAGLVTALALARTGIAVTVLERSEPDPKYGGGLAVDAAHLGAGHRRDQLGQGISSHAVVHAANESPRGGRHPPTGAPASPGTCRRRRPGRIRGIGRV
ncbi:FAD-dependent oxidoreductase [Sinomonas terrae]|uniref:FAD-dependent oxidoreductase n=1 Tax=Sinomonas terrae TaxID=2908838 RepID=UPI003557C656